MKQRINGLDAQMFVLQEFKDYRDHVKHVLEFDRRSTAERPLEDRFTALLPKDSNLTWTTTDNGLVNKGRGDWAMIPYHYPTVQLDSGEFRRVSWIYLVTPEFKEANDDWLAKLVGATILPPDLLALAWSRYYVVGNRVRRNLHYTSSTAFTHFDMPGSEPQDGVFGECSGKRWARPDKVSEARLDRQLQRKEIDHAKIAEIVLPHLS